MAKVLLRNDWWCKGLGMQQPKSDAYGRNLEIKKARKARAGDELEAARFAALPADPVTSTVALFDFGFNEVA